MLKDNNKTKQQLIDELAELRRQITESKASETERKCSEEQRPARVGEILIEMGCLTKLQ